MPELLEARNISKSYATPRGPLPILNNVTLSLAAGDATLVKLGGLWLFASEPPSVGP